MAAGDLTDLSTVKAWLNVTTTTSDGQLSGLITAASSFIGQYLGRQLLSASYTEIYQGNGQQFMLLRQAPVTAVASVQWSGVVVPAGAPLTLTSGFYVDPDNRTLRLIGYRFPWRIPLQVAYTAGFASPPPDVAQVCVELVGSRFRAQGRIDEVSKNIGSGQVVTFSAKDMNDTIKAMLAPYRFLTPFPA